MSETIPPEAEPQKAAWEERKATAFAAEDALLRLVADDVPGRADEVAKSHAQAEPAVARALGKDGVEALRSDVLRLASALADEIRGARASTSWPTTGSPLNAASNVRGAVRRLFTRERLAPLVDRLQAAGFDVAPLYGALFISETAHEDAVTAVAAALSEAEKARRALRAAIDKANSDFVEGLWTD